MQKYRNRETGSIILASQLTDENVRDISEWAPCFVVVERDAITDEEQSALNIKTPDGNRRASLGAYIIQHNEDFYVGDPEVFAEKYEPLEEAS